MRQIKFRVMDLQGIWHYFTLGDFVCQTQIPAELNPETWTQFTGLTDKKGSNIYEGDIIECWAYHLQIVWDKTDAAFFAESSDKHIYESGQEWSDNCEVIGNIYQNKELLGD